MNEILEVTVFARCFVPLQLYEKQKKEQKSTSNLESKSGERETVQRFKTMENSIVSKPINPFVSGIYSPWHTWAMAVHMQ